MNITQVVILSLVQGLTEFLPISSSAHLILVPKIFAWPDQGLLFDVTVHLGTLVAVILYFRQEILKIFREQPRLLFYILLATIPVGLCGLIIKYFFYDFLRSINTIIFSTVFFAILLFYADFKNKKNNINNPGANINKSLVKMGLFQALAVIPGVSRSGITLTSGLLSGLTREQAAKFSFLLSIPVISLAGALEVVELIDNINFINLKLLGLGFLISGVSAFLTIHLFMQFINSVSLTFFVVYRFILAGVIILFFYG